MTGLSVVMPARDTEGTLHDCLDGLSRQDLPAGSFEVIVVDNNSRNASADTARRHPGVRLLSEPRQTAYAARNLGIRAASGALIAFTDTDCVPRPDWLRLNPGRGGHALQAAARRARS